VRVTSDDLRPGGDNRNRGVEAAYLDLLFNRDLVEPVLNPANPLGFEITFDPVYDAGRSGIANSPAPGQIDEVGAFHVAPNGIGVGPDPQTVFTVRMRAKAATPAGQPMQIFGSPAEFITTPGGTIENEVLIMPNGDDASVYVSLPSAPLTIAGESQAFRNPRLEQNVAAIMPC
jgi:hypothetical protein